jgi:MFS family permease
MADQEINSRSISAATGAWIGLLVGANAIISSTTSNFMKPLAASFGVDRGTISAAISVAALTVAFAVPLCGRAMDRFGLRRVLIPGVIAFGLLMFAFSLARNVWEFAGLQVAMGIAVSMHSSVAYAKVVTQWFDRWRALVLGIIVALGAGVGQTSMPLVAQYLIDRFGWRGAYIGIGLIILCFGLPLIVWLVREPPQFERSAAQRRAERHNKGATIAGVSVRDAIRGRTFWLIFIAIMFGSMTLLGTLQHGVPMITEHGYDVHVATKALSFAFGGVVAGQLLSGAIVHHINSPKVIVPFFAAALIGLLIIHSVHVQSGVPLLLTGAALMGLGLGGEVTQNAYLVSRYFGLKAFGGIYGLTFGASNAGIAVGTFAMGKVHDIAHNYDPIRAVFGTCLGISVLCIALLGPYIYNFQKRP